MEPVALSFLAFGFASFMAGTMIGYLVTKWTR